MNLQTLESMLLWSTIINVGVLLVWMLMIVFAHDWIHRLHGRWFKLSREQFDGIHYAGLAFYKIAIYLFNFVPWLALKIAA
ncbi:hypothetical protein HED60_02580 [Planctomycetales bacterium ZRK34]|nr:hypothetical protein HED60_02580 [Planctomycetales bacterium ZRK34]